MNFSLIAFLLGRLSLALSAILLLPVGLAIFYEDGSFVEFAITSFTAFSNMESLMKKKIYHCVKVLRQLFFPGF